MRPFWLVICLLFAAAPASAQQLDLCAVQGDRTIRGLVVDSLGVPADSGSVSLYRQIEYEGRLFPQRCSTPIWPDGSFEFTRIVRDSLSLLAATTWPTRGEARVPAGSETAVLQVILTTPPPRVRDFADFEARPVALQDPDGIAGCYWLGHQMTSSRSIELRADGSVDWGLGRSESYFRWERYDSTGVRVYIWDSEIHGWAGFTMDLGPPVDWSAIPALFESKTDAIVMPNEWESFVTRVPCRGSL